MSHVFISYSKKNKEYARKLADHLLSQGFDVWIDDRIDYGDTWEREIFKAIDDCSAFLVVMTPQSYESDWVLRECHYAGRRNKPPFPVLLDGEEFPRYGITQFVDVRGGKLPPDDFYQRLEKAAPRMVGGGADITNIPSSTETPATVGLSGDLQVKVIRGSEGQKALPSVPPDVTAILPQPFEWCEIPAGKVKVEYSETDHKVFDVPQFWMAKYPITNAQYQVFVEAKDGYGEPVWWEYSDAAKLWRQENKAAQKTAFEGDDLPRTNVTWYEAVAFCQWLIAPLTSISSPSGRGEQIRVELPTEQEWQRAAQGDDGREYPWGNSFDKGRCNTKEGGIGKPTLVTGYPNGVSPYKVMDMRGNAWEWCLTQWKIGEIDLKGKDPRVMRGGSFADSHYYARAASRNNSRPGNRYDGLGFRVVSRPPSAFA